MRAARIVMHVHSEWSYDGSWALPDISRLFGRLGADAVMMSEHEDTFDEARFAAYRAACADASRAGAVLVPGIEYASPDNAVHVLAWGLTRFHGRRRPVMDILSRIRDEGGVSVLAHPTRREAHAEVRDPWVPHLAAVEIWNRKSDGLAPSAHALDLMRRYRLPGVCGMDFHRAKHLYPLYNSTEIGPAGNPALLNCATAEAAALLALRRGALVPKAFGQRVLARDGTTLSPAAVSLARLDALRLGATNMRDRARERVDSGTPYSSVDGAPAGGAGVRPLTSDCPLYPRDRT